MQAVKATPRPLHTSRLVGWAALVWLWAGPLAAQDSQRTAAEAAPEPTPAATEADPNRSQPACDECGGPTCPQATGLCSYFDGCCECGVDTRMYRSLFLGRLWGEAEYLAWACSKTHLPPLLTTGATSTAPEQAGVLGRPDTVMVFGNADFHGDLRSGGRLTGGYWFTPEHCFGVEGSFFDVEVGDTKCLASSVDFPVLARPILDAQTGLPASVLVTYPNLLTGAALVRSDVDFLGAEALLRRRLQADQGFRLDGVGGYRYQRLYDGLHVDDVSGYSLVDNTGAEIDTEVDRVDGFGSENEFHGGEAGLIGRWWGRRWALQALGKLALGGTRTVATIDGSTVTTISTTVGADTTVQTAGAAGGVLAQPSNIGRYEHSELAAVGELGIRVEYALTHQLYATFGYTLIYWSSVARVADGIDLAVDPSQDPAAAHPGFAFHDSDFWAQGLNVGLHYEF